MIGSDTSCGGTADLIRAKYTCHHWPTVHLDRTNSVVRRATQKGTRWNHLPGMPTSHTLSSRKSHNNYNNPPFHTDIIWLSTNIFAQKEYKVVKKNFKINLAAEYISLQRCNVQRKVHIKYDLEPTVVILDHNLICT